MDSLVSCVPRRALKKNNVLLFQVNLTTEHRTEMQPNESLLDMVDNLNPKKQFLLSGSNIDSNTSASQQGSTFCGQFNPILLT